ncbi:hypothetical protein [Vibrio azureus]|uniref:Uncharacterized protein n=1 Tax=Vibrio azureus NBRC 104587 TaxID=1219077 RepID=U3CEI4_9VIBR|nr:hypothetical protein [Vibrio azureus]GAD76728.1 hypothetical protein VAZ01S_050_00400 [Vibrio azureus NBRC 104587]
MSTLHKLNTIMNPAIEQLKKYVIELEAFNEFDSIEAKAEHIGLIIQIKSSNETYGY